jgi:3-polyprenyl-4-hydroxybenzoate decarboxylase
MWAISVRVNPAGDVLMLSNLAENLLDPACQPSGMMQKMIIDATMPVPPDNRGDYGEILETPAGMDTWVQKLEALMKEIQK